MNTIELNSGASIPLVGLGTFRAKGDDVYRAVRHALDVGYRHIDTAFVYGNEKDVGQAIADSGVDRDAIFVTTKVSNVVESTAQAIAQVDESLASLRTEFADLVLVHWPANYERNAAVWRGLEQLVSDGKARSIGVSNFNIHHVEALLRTAEIVPAVDQVELHVSLQNHRVKAFLDTHRIALEAFAPIKSQRVGDILRNGALQAIGEAHGKSPVQIAIRWIVQRGIVALPKSVTPARIEENLAVMDFELSLDEMATIRGLNKGERIFSEPDNVDFPFESLGR